MRQLLDGLMRALAGGDRLPSSVPSAFTLLGNLPIASSAAAATMLASTFVSRGCDLERHGELLDGMAMAGAPLGEVCFEVEC